MTIMENYVMTNLIKRLLNEMNRENGYKVAVEFNRDEITMKNVTYEQVKTKTFEMACTLVHIHYELFKLVDVLETIEKAENYVESK